jgi:hypothetical protein
MLTFKRSVQVETWTDLNLRLAARSANAPNHVGRFASFAALALSLTALVRFTRPPKM